MDYRLKNSIQQILSRIPMGHQVNLLLQRHVSHTVPCSDKDFLVKMGQVQLHLNNFEEFSEAQDAPQQYLEYGAGWELMMPLAVSTQGFDVTCLDIRRLATPKLINHTLEKFSRLRSSIPFDFSLPEKIDSLEELTRSKGLRYLAPADASDSGLTESSISFISTTSTLEHIPKDDLRNILEENFRILRSGGIASMLIDYKDHYSYSDPRLNHYHFLGYTSDQWRKLNPSLHYQNRLRHYEYLEIIQEIGFDLVKEVPYHPDEKDLEYLQGMSLAPEYERIPHSALGILGSELVLKKPKH